MGGNTGPPIAAAVAAAIIPGTRRSGNKQQAIHEKKVKEISKLVAHYTFVPANIKFFAEEAPG